MATTKSNCDLTLFRGDTKTYRFTFPYDITGIQIHFTIKEDITDPNQRAALTVSTTAGDNALDDPVNGILYLTLESNQTSKLSVQEYYFGISKVITDTIDKVTTLKVGTLEVFADVLQN